MSQAKYYILDAENPDRMLLYSMPQPPDKLRDGWMLGKRFNKKPQEPIRVYIQEGYEQKQLLPYFGHPAVASMEFIQVLRDAGVDNMDVYDVELRSVDESIVHTGYQALNIIGVVKAAGPGTTFTGDTQLIDASMDSLEIEPSAPMGLKMFRLAENLSAIVVHDKVKKAIESKGFHSVVFREPKEFLGL